MQVLALSMHLKSPTAADDVCGCYILLVRDKRQSALSFRWEYGGGGYAGNSSLPAIDMGAREYNVNKFDFIATEEPKS